MTDQKKLRLGVLDQSPIRSGGTPADAMEVFGIAHVDVHAGWRDAVDTIARALAATSEPVSAEPPFKAAA